MCVKDKQGFLWIATDEGILRFDGKHFEHYTTENGLPDIEMLEVFRDSSGIIWANTFKHSPSYYNSLTNQFINEKNDSSLAQVKNATLTLGFALKYGGMAFINNNGINFFGRNSIKIKPIAGIKFCIENKKNEFIMGSDYQFSHKVFFYKYSKLQDSITLDSIKKYLNLTYKISENGFYAANNYQLIRYSDIDKVKKKFKTIQANFSKTILNYSVTKTYVCVCLQTGEIYLLDKLSLKILQKLDVKASMNTAYEDNNNILWLCTTDKGLIKVNFQPVQNKTFPNSFQNTAFLSIAVDSTGNILEGNRFGEVITIKDKKFKINKIPNAQRSSWIRKIFVVNNNNIYTISDQGFYCNFSNIYITGNTLSFPSLPEGFKTGMFINENVFLFGTVKYLMLLNAINKKADILIQGQRITAVTATPLHQIYFGSTSGLFKYISKNTVINLSLNKNSELPGSRITYLASTKDNLVWAATASNGLIVLWKDSVIANLTIKDRLGSNLCRTVYVHDSIVWAATNNGISKIKYRLTADGSINFSIQNISEEEGLHNQLVNDLVQYHDTIYAATTNGIIFFPASITSVKEEVNTYITGINIQGRDTTLLSAFRLAYNEGSINLKFATVDLNGGNFTWQYRINNKPWVNTTTNTIIMQLSAGKYEIQIRPVDINQRVIQNYAAISFVIEPAIWQTAWFWILVSAAITALILWRYNKIKLKNKTRRYQQQIALMKERNRINADLHDDIGASLSSLQIYSTVANQLVDNDTEKAKQMLAKISIQSAKLLDNIGDIIWSMKADNDQFVSVSTRIKNFVSDVVGASAIDYNINIDSNIDNSIKNIGAKKNIILIIKEAVNNCVKYSNATCVDIKIKEDNQQLHIEITDNGEGISSLNFKKGNGLANMKKRAEELNGIFEINSKPGKGTSIICSIPIIGIRDTNA